MKEEYTEGLSFAEDEYIDLKPYIKKVLSAWRLYLKVGFVAAVAAVLLTIGMPRKYTSTSVLAPEIIQRSSSSLSSLASLAGVSISAANSEAMYPDLYPKIVNSTPFYADLLSLPLTLDVKGETLDADLYTYLSDYQKSPWWSYVLTSPMRLAGFVMNLFRNDDAESVKEYAAIDPENMTRAQSRILGKLRKSVSISVEKKTYLITVSVSMQDPDISKLVCDKIVENLKTYVTGYRTEKARRDTAYYQKINDEARESYYKAQQAYADYVDRNQGVSRQSVRIEQERLQNESSLAFSLYNSTSQQLQASSAKLQLETPVFVTIQPAVVPIKGAPSRTKILFFALVAAELLALLWVLLADWIKSLIK